MTLSLPQNVNLLTFEPWKDGALLVRFEHILERDEDPQQYSQSVTFNLADVLRGLNIAEIRETTLAANQWMNEATRFTFRESNDSNIGFDYTVSSPESTGNPQPPKPFVPSKYLQMDIHLDPNANIEDNTINNRARRHSHYKRGRYADQAADPLVITLNPMQIRTFVLKLE